MVQILNGSFYPLNTGGWYSNGSNYAQNTNVLKFGFHMFNGRNFIWFSVFVLNKNKMAASLDRFMYIYLFIKWSRQPKSSDSVQL